MENDVVVFAQVMAVIAASTAVFGAMFFVARNAWIKGSRSARAVPTARDDARLERLEAAVDAIAIEVERISEAQRYTVNLLSDRLPPRVGELPSSSAAKRLNTPH